MRKSKAAKIRKEIYGEDFSSKFRKYYKKPTGQVIADERRRAYQKMKGR
jgi:hypothetical protein